MNVSPLVIGSAAAVSIAILLAVRKHSSVEILLVATLLFVWPAITLFFDLHHRVGAVGAFGWVGLLGVAPVVILMVVVALTRYNKEQMAKLEDPEDEP